MTNPYPLGSVRRSTSAGTVDEARREGPMTIVWGSWAGVSGIGGFAAGATVLEVLFDHVRAQRRTPRPERAPVDRARLEHGLCAGVHRGLWLTVAPGVEPCAALGRAAGDAGPSGDRRRGRRYRAVRHRAAGLPTAHRPRHRDRQPRLLRAARGIRPSSPRFAPRRPDGSLGPSRVARGARRPHLARE